MPRKDRAIGIPVALGVEILYSRSSSFPIEYAIALRVVHEVSWHTIYLVDNAHGFEEHHAHAYVGDCKQPPVVFGGDTNTVMNDAMRMFRVYWHEFYERWEQAR